ncbi:NAD-dependent epimerase/dehydratase family protein [Notoacmeibacter sp. MSK16QG-6]|uniref:SDR family NAD(P)-dependent oxidoreductase n=1 Tax=Notoacmeibacter sp. MSK16QG-6 TaxID=2957982 RepID=UPI0020A20A43|nr:SDR family NAD(P)-dependent oxidoreductase [Notoacmeibacter sp. MSK16QG-6]
MKLFFFGAGYSARAVATALASDADWIGGTSRSDAQLQTLGEFGIEPFRFAGRDDDISSLPLSDVTHLLVSIAPDREGDPVLDAASEIIRRNMPALRWIGYFSTIGVYGDAEGGWIDEDTRRLATKKRGHERIAAEDAWLALGEERGIPVAILRLAGIYGPGRNQMVKITEGKARRIVKPGQVFNRIHVDDIAGATAHLLRRRARGVWNLTDDEPAPPQDVIEYAATLMGVEPPPAIDFATADLSPMARSFYGDNKRVSNAKLRQAGYSFRFPDYRSALDHLWRSGNWRGRGTLDAPRSMS